LIIDHFETKISTEYFTILTTFGYQTADELNSASYKMEANENVPAAEHDDRSLKINRKLRVATKIGSTLFWFFTSYRLAEIVQNDYLSSA
jgi:predicted subunit of tRNA(5-methylaminomethyl-2-thiouridylate) methyltransferase